MTATVAVIIRAEVLICLWCYCYLGCSQTVLAPAAARRMPSPEPSLIMMKITSPEIELARVKQLKARKRIQKEMPLVRASFTKQFVSGYLKSQINEMLK